MSKIFGDPVNNPIEKVLEEVESAVEFFFEDAEEIGSSDISCCVLSVVDRYYDNHDDCSDWEFKALRNAVMNKIHDL